MIIRLICSLLLFVSLHARAQYYYKDLVTTERTMEQLKQYKAAKVKQIKVVSYESTGDRTEDFTGTQRINNNYTAITTEINTALSGESLLTTYFDNQGKLIKTVDTTDGSGSVSEYRYNAEGRLTHIVNISTSAGQAKEKEAHIWQYDGSGRPEKMWRIKNDRDTTYIQFVKDEQGNIVEENSTRNSAAQTSYYYYYDNSNRLTDIVTYNDRAKRLLPISIFEYNTDASLKSMMVIPEGSDDYQRWVFEYDNRGLKKKETAFNKRRQLLGSIEYEYN